MEKLKKYYQVTWTVGATGYEYLEADADETEESIRDRAEGPSTPDDVEIGDPDEIVDISELTEEEWHKATKDW